MTETTGPNLETAEPEAPQDAGSVAGNVIDLYFEPEAAFRRIFVRPRIWLALLLQTALGVAFTSIWLQKVDAKAFMRAQIEQNPRVQQLDAERIEEIVNTQARFMTSWGRVAPFLAPVVLDLVLAGFLLFMFRFFLASEVSFLQSLGIVSWSFVALGLIQTPVMLAILTLKGDWNVDPNQVIQANPMVFFEASDLPGWLGALLSSLDLFSFWTIFLLGTGYATAGRRSLSTGLWGVGIPWALLVMMKVGFRLIFG